MKKLYNILFCIVSGFVSCSDGDDVFYTVDYPVTDIRTTVEVTGADPGSPILKEIDEHVIASAPVQPGGMYSLDFSVYNGGILRVKPNAEAGIVSGSFLKEPGEKIINFMFGEENYTAKVSHYQSSDEKDPVTGLAVRKTVFLIDLTKKYQEMHPEREVTRVTRYEYTSTPILSR